MLYIVDVATREILFRVDAWDSECESKAVRFLKKNGLTCTKDEITAMGDRVVWVER